MTRKLIVIILYVLVIIAAGVVFLTPAKHETAVTVAAESSEETEQRLRDTIDSAVEEAQQATEDGEAALAEDAGTGMTEPSSETEESAAGDSAAAAIDSSVAEPEIVPSDDGRYSVTVLAESIPMTARIEANLREGPASSYAQVGTIRINEKVNVLGTVDVLDGVTISPSWDEIETEDGTIAFVRSDLLTE